MKDEEFKAYQDVLKRHREAQRANETREQTKDNFEENMIYLATLDKSKTIQAVVSEELKHIPDWPEPQNYLRMNYHTRRMNSLGKKAECEQTAKEVLEECISDLKDDYPDSQFLYEEDFFNRCG